MYTELALLKKSSEESVTECMLRPENAAISLKNGGQNIDDWLLIAMLIKGLPVEFQAFSTVVTQTDKCISFSHFNPALKSFEETEQGRHKGSAQSSVMKVDGKQVLKCYSCRTLGNKKYQCLNRKNKNSD